uniref:Uncharacterized protein n=1 Tax=Theileria annulata TaxID=5874 RepID=A0A3B0MJS1_THEAN
MFELVSMSNLDSGAHSSHGNFNLNTNSIGISCENENLSKCVTPTLKSRKRSSPEDKPLSKSENFKSFDNPISDELMDSVKIFSNEVEDKLNSLEEKGVIDKNPSIENHSVKYLKTPNSRVKSTNSATTGDMCCETRKISEQTPKPSGIHRLSMLDLLMNNDNCLDETSDNVSEVYSSLTSSVNRLGTPVRSNSKDYTKKYDSFQSLSTTDIESSNAEIDRNRSEETFSSSEPVISDDTVRTEEMVTAESGYSTDIEPILDEFEHLIKCLRDPEYFEKLENPPTLLFLSELEFDKLLKLEDILVPILKQLQEASNFFYKLYVMNVALQIMEPKLNIKIFYENITSIIKVACGPNTPFNPENIENGGLEQMFIQLLNSTSSLLTHLGSDELDVLFKLLFPFFYNFYPIDMIIVAAFGVCKEIVKRLHLDQVKSALKYITSNFIFFNTRLYNTNTPTSNDSSCISKSTATENIVKVRKEDDGVKIYTRDRDTGNTNNFYYVEIIVILFEQMFINTSRIDENNIGEGIGDEKESYGIFKNNFRDFVNDTFYMENVTFRNRKVFFQILIQKLENPKHPFVSFMVYELLSMLIAHINGNYLNGKRPNEEKDVKEIKGEKNTKKLQSLRFLLIISSHMFELYNRVLRIPFVNRNKTKYLSDLDLSKNIKEITFENIKENIMGYLNYISIKDATSELDNLGTCIFYTFLKDYCYINNVKEMQQLLLFLKIFKYLGVNNANFSGVSGSNKKINYIFNNINYSHVFNYPYLSEAKYHNSPAHRIDLLILDLYVYNIVRELYDSILDTVINLIHTINENTTLRLCIDFIYEVVSKNYDYLLDKKIKTLLMISISDYNVYVRQQVINIYTNFLIHFYNRKGVSGKNARDDIEFEDELMRYISEILIDKMLLTTKDLNYKIRLGSLKFLHMFLSLVQIERYFDVVSALAGRSLDSYREHQQVKKALYNLLCSAFFIYSIETLNSDSFSSIKHTSENKSNSQVSPKEQSLKRLLDPQKKMFLERFVRVILYKMESYKGKLNPILIMFNYYQSNTEVILDPIGYYGGNRNSQMTRKDLVGNNTNLTDPETIVNNWLENLLDLFLMKRSTGARYFELTEALSVFKLFGEVYPKLFVKHLVYFIPYLKLVDGILLDVEQVNLIISINNLIIIVYRYLKNAKPATKGDPVKDEDEMLCELNNIANNVVGLVNYNSPILVRSIIQLLTYNNQEYLMKIYETSFKYLNNIKKILSSFLNSNLGKDKLELRSSVLNHKMLGNLNVSIYSWQLACISEFNETEFKVFKLFIEIFKLYNGLDIENISGLLIQCCCRYMSNLNNLFKVDHKELKSVLSEIYEYYQTKPDKYNNLILILNRMLNTYHALSSSSDSENIIDQDTKTQKEKRDLINLMYIMIQKYTNAFMSLITNYYDNEGKAGITDLENHLYFNKEENQEKLFGEVLYDKYDKVVYMEIIEIIIVNRLTNVQELLPFVFAQLISPDLHVQRVAENNLKIIIKQDINLFLGKMNTCFETLFKSVVHQFFRNSFVLGVAGEFIHSALQGVFRIYLELLQAKRSNTKMFITSLLMQTKTIHTIEFKDWIEREIKLGNRNDWKLLNSMKVYEGFINKLKELVDKIKVEKGEERNKLFLEYFQYLYANLICVLLDGLTFKNKKDSAFAITKIRDVVNDNTHILTSDDKITKFVNIRLKRISNRIKNTYK